MELNIKAEGLDDILKKIGELTIRKTLNNSVKKSIIFLEREAKIETPVDTGILRNSYESIFTDLSGTLRNFRIYAPFVHFGHKQEVGRYVGAIGKRLKQPFVKGNPWMDRTLLANDEKVQKIFENDIEKLLNSLVD